jgi:hypothetical protein
MTLPLWLQMEAAYFAGREPGYCERKGYAAELRLIADLIDQRRDQGLDLDPGETAEWLRAEAEEAEAP